MDTFLKWKTTTCLLVTNGLLFYLASVGNEANPHPRFTLKDMKLWNFVKTAMYHMNCCHFTHNMLFLLYYGGKLEQRMGSAKFGITAIVLMCLSHLLLAAASLSEYLVASGNAHVGFSAVLFSLKVVLNEEFHGLLNGVNWMEWFVLPILFPERAVIVGLFCGILAGCIYIRALKFLCPIRDLDLPPAVGNEYWTWGCPNCQARNGVYLQTCENCHQPRMGH